MARRKKWRASAPRRRPQIRSLNHHARGSDLAAPPLAWHRQRPRSWITKKRRNGTSIAHAGLMRLRAAANPDERNRNDRTLLAAF